MTTAAPIAIITTAALTAEWKATDAEVTLWSTMAAIKTADLAVNKLGLFGADLTSFNEKCAADTATTAKCSVTTYEKYNGWGVGISFGATVADRTEAAHGAGFVLSKQWVQVTWVAAATGPTVISGLSTVAIAVATPTSTAADVTDAPTADGFAGWILTGALPATLKAAGFAARFFLETDAEVDNSFFFEADETTDIFSISASTTPPTNVANTGFKLVSASALCTAATSVIAASLLF